MKKIISILICVCNLALSLIACCGSTTAEAKVEENNRLRVMEDISISANDSIYIIVDNETRVCYLYTEGIECCAVTVMLDSDGYPLLWEDVR